MSLATVLCAVTVSLAACGASSKPVVCHVRPSTDGRTLIYSPPGCQKHLHGGTLDIQTAP